MTSANRRQYQQSLTACVGAVSRSIRCATIVLAGATILIHSVRADGPTTGKGEPRIQAARTFVAQIRFDSDSLTRSSKVALVDQPVLQFSDLPRDNPFGSVWLWQRGARPVAIIEVYTSSDGEFQNVMHSLSSSSFESSTSKGWRWRPLPGLKLKTLDEPNLVAESASGRLAQARQIARSLKVIQQEYFDPERRPTELRLLTQPIYRFSVDETDGFLFAFVHGETNPEVVLQLEASDRKWRIAFARLGHAEMTAYCDESEVWHVPRLEHFVDETSPYSYLPTTLADLPPSEVQPGAVIAP